MGRRGDAQAAPKLLCWGAPQQPWPARAPQLPWELQQQGANTRPPCISSVSYTTKYPIMNTPLSHHPGTAAGLFHTCPEAFLFLLTMSGCAPREPCSLPPSREVHNSGSLTGICPTPTSAQELPLVEAPHSIFLLPKVRGSCCLQGQHRVLVLSTL